MADVEQRAEAEAEKKGLHGEAEQRYVGGVFNKIRQAHARGTTPGKGARHLKREARKEARREAQNRAQRHAQLGALERFRLRARTRREEPREKKQDAPSEYTQGEYRAALARHDYEAAVRWGKLISPQAQADAQRMLDEAQSRKRKPARAPEQAAPAAAQARPATKLRPAGSKLRQPLVPIKPIPGFQLDATRELDPYFIREHFGDKQLPTALEIQPSGNLAEAVGAVEKKTGKKYTGSKRDRGAMYDWILANM